jgi:hypothetical protein
MSLDIYLESPPCEHCGRGDDTVWQYNVTHNLARMADAAGLYQVMWRPEEIGVVTAADALPHLRAGWDRLTANDNVDAMLALSPTNGWGTYDGLCRAVSAYIGACVDYPHALVRVSR